jgi:hypothetical protein
MNSVREHINDREKQMSNTENKTADVTPNQKANELLKERRAIYRARAKRREIKRNLFYAQRDFVTLVENFADDFSVFNQEPVFREKPNFYDYHARTDFIKEFVNEVLSVALKRELVSKYRYLPLMK